MNVAEELEKLNHYETVCMVALDRYKADDKEKIIPLLHRMFEAEKDYLQENPQDYFDLYAD